MMLPPEVYWDRARTGQLGTAQGHVTVQPTTHEQIPALQKLVESHAVRAMLAQRMQSKQPAVMLNPAVLASLPLSQALAALGPLQFPSPEPVKPDSAPNASGAPPRPAAMAPQYVGPASTNLSGQTVFVHVTTAEELRDIFARKKQPVPVDLSRVAIGASAGAAIGLGYALVRQSVGAVHPAAGVAFDLGWILMGLGLGAGASAAWELTFDPKEQAFGVKPAS